MNKYMIELHLVMHEMTMFLADIEMYGEITHYNERLPTYVWIESPWDQDIIETIHGIKKVYSPLYRPKNHESTLKDISQRRGLI